MIDVPNLTNIGMGELTTTIFLFLQTVILLLLGIGIKTLMGINGKVSKLDSWTEAHQKQDDERHDIESLDRRDLWSKVNKMTEKEG